jgi:hypothetical protein
MRAGAMTMSIERRRIVKSLQLQELSLSLSLSLS